MLTTDKACHTAHSTMDFDAAALSRKLSDEGPEKDLQYRYVASTAAATLANFAISPNEEAACVRFAMQTAKLMFEPQNWKLWIRAPGYRITCLHSEENKAGPATSRNVNMMIVLEPEPQNSAKLASKSLDLRSMQDAWMVRAARFITFQHLITKYLDLDTKDNEQPGMSLKRKPELDVKISLKRLWLTYLILELCLQDACNVKASDSAIPKTEIQPALLLAILCHYQQAQGQHPEANIHPKRMKMDLGEKRSSTIDDSSLQAIVPRAIQSLGLSLNITEQVLSLTESLSRDHDNLFRLEETGLESTYDKELRQPSNESQRLVILDERVFTTPSRSLSSSRLVTLLSPVWNTIVQDASRWGYQSQAASKPNEIVALDALDTLATAASSAPQSPADINHTPRKAVGHSSSKPPPVLLMTPVKAADGKYFSAGEIFAGKLWIDSITDVSMANNDVAAMIGTLGSYLCDEFGTSPESSSLICTHEVDPGANINNSCIWGGLMIQTNIDAEALMNESSWKAKSMGTYSSPRFHTTNTIMAALRYAYISLLSNEVGKLRKRERTDEQIRSDLRGLLEKPELRKAILICCTETVSSILFQECHGQPAIAESLSILNLEPIHFSKVAKLYIQAILTLPRIAARRIAACEQIVLEELVWRTRDSQLMHALRGEDSPLSGLALEGFLQVFCNLASKRIRELGSLLSIPSPIATKIWVLFKACLTEHWSLFVHRHLDQIIMACFYGVCKVEGKALSFRELVTGYRQMLHVFYRIAAASSSQHPVPDLQASLSISEVYNQVLLSDAAKGDIIKFYNTVFVQEMKAHLLTLKSIAAEHRENPSPEEVESKDSGEDLHATPSSQATKPNLEKIMGRVMASPLYKPVLTPTSSKARIMVSPMKSSVRLVYSTPVRQVNPQAGKSGLACQPMLNLQSPSSSFLYAIGESPGMDLEKINRTLRTPGSSSKPTVAPPTAVPLDRAASCIIKDILISESKARSSSPFGSLQGTVFASPMKPRPVPRPSLSNVGANDTRPVPLPAVAVSTQETMRRKYAGFVSQMGPTPHGASHQANKGGSG